MSASLFFGFLVVWLFGFFAFCIRYFKIVHGNRMKTSTFESILLGSIALLTILLIMQFTIGRKNKRPEAFQNASSYFVQIDNAGIYPNCPAGNMGCFATPKVASGKTIQEEVTSDGRPIFVTREINLDPDVPAIQPIKANNPQNAPGLKDASYQQVSDTLSNLLR